MWRLSFCDWLTSLSVKSSRFTGVVAHCRIFFLFKTELYSIVCSISHILFIYSSVKDVSVVSTSRYPGFLVPFSSLNERGFRLPLASCSCSATCLEHFLGYIHHFQQFNFLGSFRSQLIGYSLEWQ